MTIMHSSLDKVFIGVDPGSVNLGYAIISNEGKVLGVGGMNPSLIGLTETVQKISSLVPDKTIPILSIERYVAYKGVMNSASEEILMLIGALVYEFERREETVLQFRAIDWKPELCKRLYKDKGFKNPSSKFDKKFSMAACKELTGMIPSNDHEADAICLAFHGKEMYVKQFCFQQIQGVLHELV